MRPLTLAVFLLSASLAFTAAARAANPLSVHVLDLQTGEPTAGIAVTLEQRAGNDWRRLATGTTDNEGRVRELFPAGKLLTKGEYRIVFNTGDHYNGIGKPGFFPRVPVEFNVDDTTRHYHVPLLLSPFGYSTYRGN
ncbi:hydroxyisourate hydrolase [Pseudoduganella plicata]|uniref:5-hydroxyisourate hydrolase n=1 Tax=Pseudoduganella plicata TaxID=321984 RepID=A0A4P7BBS6_9BURK|nr:hydroxyisourate hydrolase [Pseudoduganella plicata]QBQ35402.1 hydroxyisourate hydrolase [Pseudoduganella plicata]GGZ01451.1 5-hydroxyisourate hydrolase [Pseudoduganella plicata]